MPHKVKISGSEKIACKKYGIKSTTLLYRCYIFLDP